MQQGKGRKRGATRGRGRGSTVAKRGRKSDNTSSSIQQMMMSKDDDDDDDDDVPKRTNKSQPRVSDVFLVDVLSSILFRKMHCTIFVGVSFSSFT